MWISTGRGKLLSSKLVVYMRRFSLKNEEIPQNLEIVSKFQSISWSPYFYWHVPVLTQIAGKILTVGNSLFFFLMFGGQGGLAQPGIGQFFWTRETFCFLVKVLFKSWGLMKNLGYPTCFGGGAQSWGDWAGDPVILLRQAQPSQLC